MEPVISIPLESTLVGLAITSADDQSTPHLAIGKLGNREIPENHRIANESRYLAAGVPLKFHCNRGNAKVIVLPRDR